jgi:DNA-binding NarL/FixJ family response regulator
VLVTPRGKLSELLVHVVEREFPWLTVVQVNAVSAACAAFKYPAQLILIDSVFHAEVDRYGEALARHHPKALAALMVEEQTLSPVLAASIVFSSTIRGVLPMDMRLELWLSVMRLLLQGAPYLPPSIFAAAQGWSGADHVMMAGQHEQKPAAKAGAATMDNLTAREREVLTMVSRGFQNKVIAAELGLSQHTVKVHLHNIISKLGAHNRTEAAAIYHEYLTAQGEAEQKSQRGREEVPQSDAAIDDGA